MGRPVTIMELEDIDGVGPATEEKLRDAEIDDPEDLLEADLEALAEAAEVGVGRLEGFVDQVEDALEAEAPTAGEGGPGEAAGTEGVGEVREAEGAGEAPEEDLKVVLREGTGAASVQVGADLLDDVPIVTATSDEDPLRKLEQVREDAVLLQEQHDTGAVRVGDVTYENVPLVRRREKEGGVVEETRVQVEDVREKDPKKGGLVDRVRGLFR